MNPTTKTQVSQSDYNNLADWAKKDYQVYDPNSTFNMANNNISTPTTPVINQSQPNVGLSITPESLQPTNAVKVPQIKPVDTGASSVIATTQPSVETAQKNFEQTQQAVGTKAEDARNVLTRLAENVFGQKAEAQANQVNLENQAGLLEQQKALGEINTQIANEQVGLRNEQEKIRQGYGTEAQKAISQNTLLDTYGRRLADLAIRQSAANQNITAIQDNAERQTRLLIAPLDTKIQYLSTFAKDNVDYLDKKQTEKLNFIVDDLKSQKQDIQSLQNAKTAMITEIANNGGGTNTQLIKQIQDAQSIGDVTSIGAGSGYIGKLDRAYKNAQISKIYQDMAESRATQEAKKANLVLTPVKAQQEQSKIQQITDLTKGGASAVGTSILTRAPSGFWGTVGKIATVVGIPSLIGDAYNKMTGKQQEFIGSVEQLRQQLTLDNLVNAKANGATFGALSEGELKLLNASASKLGTWAIEDGNGNVVGYNTSESSFRKELDKINNFSKLDYLYRGGNPADIGVITTPDGQYATQNSDGTYTILN